MEPALKMELREHRGILGRQGILIAGLNALSNAPVIGDVEAISDPSCGRALRLISSRNNQGINECPKEKRPTIEQAARKRRKAKIKLQSRSRRKNR